MCALERSGNPDSPHLTKNERRVIKRRIANRKSAQRAKEKKQEDEKATADAVRSTGPPGGSTSTTTLPATFLVEAGGPICIAWLAL